MKLATALASIYEEELLKTLNKEQNEDKYLPQEAFEGGEQRANSISFKAKKRCDNILALATCYHRKKKHNDDSFDAEISTLESQMIESDIELAIKSWWN